jgi:PAS domain S-box-containing protein
MGTPLRVLIVDDSPDDAELIARALRKSGYDVATVRVDTPEAMAEALEREVWDIVISDYSMPRFSGFDALTLLQKGGPDIPFILVSGAVGEDTAVLAMKAGAHDYLMKHSLTRLGPAVTRELREAEVRRDRRLAEEAMRVSEEQYRLLAENATDMISRHTPDATFRYVSPASRVLLGYEPEELVGRAGYDFLHPDDVEVVRSAHVEVMSSRRTVTTQYRVRRKPGDFIWIETNARSIRDPATGAVEEIVSVARDVSERKLAEEALARARDDALESSRLKSAFLANMSHEIRTPLNVIIGFTEIMHDEAARLGGDWSDILGGVGRATARLIDTVSSVLDMSRLETGTFEFHPGPVRLPKVLETEIKRFAPLAARKGVALTYEIAEPEATVVFDEYALSRSLRCLLDNAVKFTSEGTIAVRLGRDQRGLLAIEVCDSGVGIDPDYASRLFQIFSQQDASYTRAFEGSGLGLALTKRLLEANDATIEVQSELGKGSTFTIRFDGARKGG